MILTKEFKSTLVELVIEKLQDNNSLLEHIDTIVYDTIMAVIDENCEEKVIRRKESLTTEIMPAILIQFSLIEDELVDDNADVNHLAILNDILQHVGNDKEAAMSMFKVYAEGHDLDYTDFDLVLDDSKPKRVFKVVCADSDFDFNNI